MGWFHFRPRRDAVPGEVELGCRLRKSAWGKGYATEGSCALICKGFTEFGVQRVVAEAMTVNVASRRVMEKAGLKLVRTFYRKHSRHALCVANPWYGPGCALAVGSVKAGEALGRDAKFVALRVLHYGPALAGYLVFADDRGTKPD